MISVFFGRCLCAGLVLLFGGLVCLFLFVVLWCLVWVFCYLILWFRSVCGFGVLDWRDCLVFYFRC